MKRQVAIGDEFGKRLKLSRDQRRRAVAGLEAAGLIEVERKPNHAPRVRLVPWESEDGEDSVGQLSRRGSKGSPFVVCLSAPSSSSGGSE
jgi:hypothetical protein